MTLEINGRKLNCSWTRSCFSWKLTKSANKLQAKGVKYPSSWTGSWRFLNSAKNGVQSSLWSTFFLRQVQLPSKCSPLIGPTMTLTSHWSGYCGNYANPAKARPLIGQDIVAIMQISDFSNASPTPTLLQGGGHISDTINHRPQVLYIFGILGSRPPLSCMQNTIGPHRAS